MSRPFFQVVTLALLVTIVQAIMQQSSSSGGPFYAGSYSSSSSNNGFVSSYSSVNPLPLIVRILVRRGTISNLSQGNGQLTLFNDGTGIHIVANGQRFDSNDVIGPYVVTNEDGPLVRREFTKEDELMEQRQKQAMRDAWNAMDDSFASNWNKNFQPMQPMAPMPPMPPMQPMKPMQPMQPFRMRSLF